MIIREETIQSHIHRCWTADEEKNAQTFWIKLQNEHGLATRPDTGFDYIVTDKKKFTMFLLKYS